MSPRNVSETQRRNSLTRRALLIGIGQASVAAILAGRMYRLQILESEHYSTLAEDNRVKLRLVPPVRGRIFDRKGVPIATNEQNLRLTTTAQSKESLKASLEQLGQLIDLPQTHRETILEKSAKYMREKRFYEEISMAENLDWDAFSRVNLNAPGLAKVTPKLGWTRKYHGAKYVSHITGYVGPPSEDDLNREKADPLLKLPGMQIGTGGIEKALEAELRGAAGAQHVETNSLNRVIRELAYTEAKPGDDLTLTIDLALHKKALERLEGQSASVVVMDIWTGKLLTMISAPSFDANLFIGGISHKNWRRLNHHPLRPLTNKALFDAYPPGSTFKMIVALAGMQQGIIDTASQHKCMGSIHFGNRDFHCWKRQGHGVMNVHTAIEQSCDVFFYEVARALGVDTIAEYARMFGLGQVPQFELSNGKAGIVPTKAWKRGAIGEPWQGGETLHVGIGQGYVLATPLQLAIMTARIANGGYLVNPRLVEAVGGKPVKVPPLERMKIDQRHIETVKRAMYAVSNSDRGTARGSRIPEENYHLAGKTGTSQVRRITKEERTKGIVKNEDLPWKRRDHALFVAYAPAHEPRYAISVVVEHGGGGSSTAAPIARDVMRAVFDLKQPKSQGETE